MKPHSKFSVLLFLVIFFTTNTALAQTPAQNKAACSAFYDAFNARDLNKIKALCANDFMDHALPPGMAEQTGLSGYPLLEDFLQELFTGFPDVKLTPIRLVSEGDVVMAYVRMAGTNSGPFAGMPPTGNSFSLEDVDMVRFDQSGKAVEHWAIQDGTVMMSQLGFNEPPAANDQAGKNFTQTGLDFLAAMDASDLEGFKACTAPDFKIFHPNFPQPLQLNEFFEMQVKPFNAAFENFTHTVVESACEGNKLTMRGMASGKHIGPLMGIPPTGNAISIPWLAFATMDENGKMKELHVQFNQLSFLGQLGVNPLAKN